MARKILFILAAGVLLGAMFGAATAESPQHEQGLQSAPPAEFVPEGNWSGTDWQAGWQTSEEMETGAVPVAASEEPWMRMYGQD